MTIDLTAQNLLPECSGENLFLAALPQIDYLLSYDRPEAVRVMRHALAFAYPEDCEFFRILVDVFTRYPFKVAQELLQKYGKAHPEHEDRIAVCTPSTRPDLHSRHRFEQTQNQIVCVSLDAVGLPRQSIRSAYREPNLHATPTPSTDLRVHAPEWEDYRVAMRKKRRPATDPSFVDHYFRELQFSDWLVDITRAVKSGNTQRIFALQSEFPIDHDHEEIHRIQEFVRPIRRAADAAAEIRKKRLLHDPEWRRKHDLAKPTAEVELHWNRVYLAYVTEQFERESVYEGRPQPKRPTIDFLRQQVVDAYARQEQRYTSRYGIDGLYDVGPELLELVTEQTAEFTYDTAIPVQVSERRAMARTGLWDIGEDVHEPMPINGNGLDYDTASEEPVKGWRCVHCFIERSRTDNQHTGRHISDDGLCIDCHDAGYCGIEPLPTGYTRADFALAYCEFIATNYPDSARAILRAEWRHISREEADAIEQFFAVNPGIPGAPAATDASSPGEDTPRAFGSHARNRGPVIGRGQRRDRCRACFHDTGVHHDGYCTPCRIALGRLCASCFTDSGVRGGYCARCRANRDTASVLSSSAA